MSRCFPFPPPGYEKKARPDDDANILIKEKHKEKKLKKDKKDKEKKEKKEKDKEKNGEKNGEKKERKRKHKDKDKNKEKEEKRDSEGKKIVSSSSHRNGEKLGPFGIQVDQTHQQGRLLLELEKGDGKWNGPKEIQSLDKISFKEHSIKSSGKELESNHGIFVEGSHKIKDNREENRMPNDQSCTVVGKHLENGSVGNIMSKEQKAVEGAVCQEEKVSEKRKERKDKNGHKSSDGRGDRHKDGDRERKSKSKDKKEKKEKMEEKAKKVSTPVQTKLTENVNNSVDIQSEKGSYLFKGSNSNNGSLGKRKEPEMNGFVHGNGSPINKLPQPLLSSMVKQNGINGATNPGIRFAMKSEAAGAKHKLDAKASSSRPVSENGTKLDSRQTANNYAPGGQEAVNNHHHKAVESLSSSQPSLGIGRKPCQTALNFTSKEQGVVSDYKLNKKVLSLEPSAENGRKLESSQPCTFSSAERKGAVSKPKIDNQEMRINGLGLRKPDACSMRPPVADQIKETAEAHLKPPHPDAKYLTEILTVPKVEWSDIDDQSWLFAREDNGGKKPKIDSTRLEESKKVWAEALHLESADVTALPYVIPY